MRAPVKLSLVHIGEKKLDDPKISIMEYDESRFSMRDLKPEEIAGLTASDGVVWINVDGSHDQKTLEALGQRFGIHPLVISEMNDNKQRPRLEEFDDCIFLIMKMLYVDADAER